MKKPDLVREVSIYVGCVGSAVGLVHPHSWFDVTFAVAPLAVLLDYVVNVLAAIRDRLPNRD